MDRTHWPNRWVFILAAIGSAAGLGNLWRFPFLAFEHGGAAFLVVLVLANIVIGIPLLIGEISLGQMTQKSAPDAFSHIKKKLRYIGWLSVVFGFLVITYYMAVMGWSVDYFASSFTLSWGDDTGNFFFNDILNISDGVGDIRGISWPVFSGVLLAWALVYFSVWKGVKSVSRVVVWTATLPFAILLILIIRAVTLPGAVDGLKLFFIPDWRALSNPELWLAALSQVFFSLSLAFGIMVAYGSFNRENTEITKSALWITGGNLLVSVMSGVVVFGTLGYMAFVEGVTIPEVFAGGPALAFVVFPKAISLLPSLNSLIALLFFGTLLSLAIDSAFSLVEAFSAPFRDRFPNISTQKIALFIAFFGIIGGLIFTTHAGLYFLDIVDHFIVNYGLVVVGIIEAISIGWLVKDNEIVNFVNERSKLAIGSFWKFSMKIVTPLLLAIFLTWNLMNEFKTPYEGYPTWALVYIGAVTVVVVAPVIAIILEIITRKNN